MLLNYMSKPHPKMLSVANLTTSGFSLWVKHRLSIPDFCYAAMHLEQHIILMLHVYRLVHEKNNFKND